MKKDNVTHKGIITSIGPGTITIRTDEACRCDGCAITALCNKADSDGHENVTIDIPDSSSYSVGERVEVVASSGSTLLATWWALALPAILFIGVILGVRYTWPESGAWSVAAGFAALALYDLLLYLFRRALAHKLIWTIKRL